MALKNKNKSGFTLIETAVVLIIFGLLTAGVIKIYEQYVVNKRKADFTKTMNAVTSAMAYYIQDEGVLSPAVADLPGTAGVNESVDPTHYPCPASPLFGPGDPNYGVEQRDTNTGRCLSNPANGVVTRGPAGNRVFIGSIPTVTLGISNAHMADPYGRRLTYAVSSSVSSSMPVSTASVNAPGGAMGGGLNPTGSITLRQYDTSGAVTATKTNVPFVIVAHGDNGAGAYSLQGGGRIPCTAATGGRDIDNCDNDAGNIFADATNFASSNTASGTEYDDTIVFSLKGIADKEEYWGLGTNTTDLVTLNTGNIGIGTSAPAQKLDIVGRVRAHSYLHSSDRRLKKNIEPLSNDALKKIMMIKSMSYDYINKPEDYKRMGFIAQDLQKVYPGVVYKDGDGYLSVDYIALMAPTIKALQQLSLEKDKEIEGLKKELENTNKRLDLLEKNISNQPINNQQDRKCYNE